MYDHREVYPGDHGILFKLDPKRTAMLWSYEVAKPFDENPPVPVKLIKAWSTRPKHPRGEPGNAGEFGPGGGTTDVTAPTHDPDQPSETSLIAPHLSDTRTLPPLKGATESREVQEHDQLGRHQV